MRYIIFSCFLLCSILGNAKEYESGPTNNPLRANISYWEMKDRINLQNSYKQTIYWKKYKRMKVYAFSVLGLGVCGTIVGWTGKVANNAHTNSNWKEDGKPWDVVLGIGLGLTISSIPLFIISHKNKKKAKNSIGFSLNSSMIRERIQNGAVITQPALGVCVSF